jgi:hypothetical protein
MFLKENGHVFDGKKRVLTQVLRMKKTYLDILSRTTGHSLEKLDKVSRLSFPLMFPDYSQKFPQCSLKFPECSLNFPESSLNVPPAAVPLFLASLYLSS